MFFRCFLKIIYSINIFLIFLLFLGSCETVNNNDTVVFPSENISYFQHVSPFFDEQCYCHRNNGSALHIMDISTPEKIEDLYWERFLYPGDAVSSDLYLSMKYPDRPAHLIQMPLNKPPVNSNQQNGIRVWIQEGAKVDQ